MIFAHIGPVPVEEMLPALGGASTAWLVVRAWVTLRVRRRREPGE